MSHWSRPRSDIPLSHLALIPGATIAYVVIFLLLYRVSGVSVVSLSAMPIMMAGWVVGMRAGLVAGLLAVLINTLLLNAIGEPGWNALILHGGTVGSITGVLLGAIVGRLHELEKNLHRQLTELQQSEIALRASEERFRMVTEGGLAGVFIIRGNLFLYVNPTLSYIFGYLPEEIIGKMGPLDLADAASRTRVADTLHAITFSEDSAAHCSFSGSRKDGATVYCEMLGRSADYQGQAAIIGTLLDVTERKQAQAELLKAERLQVELEKEKELSELKSRFVSMVSHDFRNPLAVISTSVQILRRFGDRIPEEKRNATYDRIQMNIEHLANLLSETLTISKADMVGLDFHPVSLDVRGLCAELIEESKLADDGKHDIVWTSTGGAREIAADPKLLRQALTNLLTNAIKYTPPGRKVCLHLSTEHDHVEIYVQDEGIGIPQEDHARLFESFHRAQNVGTIPGTGLGLVIVKLAVEAHSGTVSFNSVEGVGTTFIIKLPIIPGTRQAQ